MTFRKLASPFGEKAASSGYAWTGGKVDDTTVIVAQVVVETK